MRNTNEILDEQDTSSSSRLSTQEERVAAGTSSALLAHRRAINVRQLYWGAIPLLAIAAYLTVGQIDFLGDDLLLLHRARSSGPTLEVFVPNANWYFYRPLGTLFTWQIGWQLWGFNPVPYHLLSILAHSLVSLVLGLWLAELTGRRALAWVAAAFFAVFPLHVEAIGWLASQWDLWAALFGLLSLRTFTRWWRKRDDKVLYWLSVVFFAAGIFTKESLFTFIPVFALTAWVASNGKDDLSGYGSGALNWRRLALALVPFVGVLALNLGIRLVVLGRIGGYPGVRFDYQNFIWDALIDSARLLLAPLSPMVFGGTTVQIVGLLFTLGLLLGLTLFGSLHTRLFILAFTWILLTLLPVLNFGVNTDTLESARFLYLPSIAYCIIVGTLLYSTVQAAGTIGPRFHHALRIAMVSGVGLLLVLGVASSWVQLGPWRTVSVQSRALDEELLHLIPPEPRPRPMWWFIKDRPHFDYGVDFFSLGFSFRRFFIGKRDIPFTETVESTSDVPVVEEPNDAFVVRFYHDASENLFHVDYLLGVTADLTLPTGQEVGEGFLLWDFTGCDPDVLKQWDVVQAQTECTPGGGLIFNPSGADGQLTNSNLSYNIDTAGERFVRVRVAVQYDPIEDKSLEPSAWAVSQWFWTDRQGEWSEERSQSLRLKRDGKGHVYWVFIPVDSAGSVLKGLRFDPANLELGARIRWIAVDQVK